nr:HIPL1 protein-like [Ipomoea batatas]
MRGILFIFLLNSLQLLRPAAPFPLCTNSRPPFAQNSPLEFCTYSGPSCCTSADDSRLHKRFQAMNISDSACAAIFKSILCAECNKFSAELYKISSFPRQVPILCNSSSSGTSNKTSQDASNFCSKVWNSCQNVSVMNSPFAASLKGRNPSPLVSNFTKLRDFWKSETDFCHVFGGASVDESLCFDGGSIILNSTEPPSPPSGLCLERIANGSYLDMAAHPDGSNRAFFASQQGKIWLATIPKVDSGGLLELDEASPFLDISDQVYFNSELGMMGIAFHPKFSQNGRFFVSFNCDKQQSPGCGGRCACNSDVNCDPSKLPPDSGAQPCQYQAVIAEFTVNGTSSQPSQAKIANAKEVRRIFTMGLPFLSHHGGQILFGPTDGYLYLSMGDGGGLGDPYNFAQNKNTLLGKIIRLDIDTIPSATEVMKLGLWGNYSIPKDNPYAEDKELQPEIWALGLRNPWRCSFDSSRPSYFMCADVGQDRYEEVNIITKGGNYGWRVYEGQYPYTPPKSPGGNTSANSINPLFPVMGYNHSEVHNNEGSASITGGYFYHSTTDPCMYGRYLYADLYAGGIWAGTENPRGSGVFNTSEIPFACSRDSPINCTLVPGSSVPALGYIFSFGEDNNKDMYILASSGVYRVVPPSRCKYICSKENDTSTIVSPSPPSSPSGVVALSAVLYNNLVLLLLTLYFLLVC